MHQAAATEALEAWMGANPTGVRTMDAWLDIGPVLLGERTTTSQPKPNAGPRVTSVINA